MGIVIMNGDMWQGMYINGELVHENHRIYLDEFTRFLEEYCKGEVIGELEFSHEYCDYDWLEERGNLPEKYEDVKTVPYV